MWFDIPWQVRIQNETNQTGGWRLRTTHRRKTTFFLKRCRVENLIKKKKIGVDENIHWKNK